MSGDIRRRQGRVVGSGAAIHSRRRARGVSDIQHNVLYKPVESAYTPPCSPTWSQQKPPRALPHPSAARRRRRSSPPPSAPSGASGSSSPPTSGTGTPAMRTSRPSGGSRSGASAEASPLARSSRWWSRPTSRSSLGHAHRRPSSSTSRRCGCSSTGSSSARSSHFTPRVRFEGLGMSSRPARPQSSPRRRPAPSSTASTLRIWRGSETARSSASSSTASRG